MEGTLSQEELSSQRPEYISSKTFPIGKYVKNLTKVGRELIAWVLLAT
jgi:hypothetical protein